MSFPPEPRQAGNTFGFTAWRGPSTVMASPHAHNDIEINFCSSPLTYDSGGRTSTMSADVPFVFWGAKPHQLIDIDPTQPLAFATVPLARFMSWGIPSSAKNRLLHGAILNGVADGDPSSLAASFERWAVDLHRGGELPTRAAALEIEALLLRMTLGEWNHAEVDAERSSTNLRRAAEMATFIAEHATTDLRVRDVAEVVHLHPNRASAIFREVFGTTITGYVGQHRVAEAQRLLVTTELGSAAVAELAGFQSLSSFHETFTAVCGASPARWRRRQIGGS
jgi:AraC-like DNA-binding protein